MPLLEKKIETGCKNSFLKSFSMCGVSPVMFHFAYQFEMEVMKVYTERSNKPYRDKKKILIALPTINPLQFSLSHSCFLSISFFSFLLSLSIYLLEDTFFTRRKKAHDGWGNILSKSKEMARCSSITMI